MFANIYQRLAGSPPAPAGPPVPGGWWPDRATADEMAKLNEAPTFKRIMCLEGPKSVPPPCTA